jgi:hypothetical protein
MSPVVAWVVVTIVVNSLWGSQILMAYPSSTGAQLFLFASEGQYGYATWAAGPETSRMSVVGGLFLPAPHKAATRAAGPAFTCVAVSLLLVPREAGEADYSPLRPFSCPQRCVDGP